MTKTNKEKFLKECKRIYDVFYEGVVDTFEIYNIYLPLKHPPKEYEEAAIYFFMKEHIEHLEERKMNMSFAEIIKHIFLWKYPEDIKLEEHIIKLCDSALQSIDLLRERYEMNNRHDEKANEQIAEVERRAEAAKRRAEAEARHKAYLEKEKALQAERKKPSAERREEYTIDDLISNLENSANSENYSTKMKNEILKFKSINQGVNIDLEKITIKSTSKVITARVLAALLKNRLVTNSQVIDYVRKTDIEMYDRILVELDQDIFKNGKKLDGTDEYVRDISAILAARAEDKKRE